MKNITYSEWLDESYKLVAVIEKRWPAVRAEVDEGTFGITVQTDACTGTLDLQTIKAKYWATRVRVGSGVALGGDLSVVETGLYEYRAVVDALHYLGAASAHMAIWNEKDCPCDRCSAKGDIRGTPCTACNGEGKR